jgi:1-deoxy-D-xylulose-5-phosphate synthase
LPETFSEVPLGEAEVLREGADVQIWALGDMIPVAEETRNLLAGKRISAGIVNPRFICPLDEAVLKAQAETAGAIVTLENAVAQGGFGSAVEECLGRIGFRGRVLCFGWPARFVSHGARDVLMRQHGLAAPDISQAVLDALRQERR